MAGNIERDDEGRFDSGIPTETILAFFDTDRPFHTAQEVADNFGIDRSTAFRRLERLADDGRLTKVSLGSRTVVWWDRPTVDEAEGFDANDPLFSAPAVEVDDPIDEDEIDDLLYGAIDE